MFPNTPSYRNCENEISSFSACFRFAWELEGNCVIKEMRQEETYNDYSNSPSFLLPLFAFNIRFINLFFDKQSVKTNLTSWLRTSNLGSFSSYQKRNSNDASILGICKGNDDTIYSVFPRPPKCLLHIISFWYLIENRNRMFTLHL